MNRELVKPHLYPRNRNPRKRKPSFQESEPSLPAKDAFALLRVDVRDRGRPGKDFLGFEDLDQKRPGLRSEIREEALFAQNPMNRFRRASPPAGPIPPRLRPRSGRANEALVRNCRWLVN